jgi:hypothetical protein
VIGLNSYEFSNGRSCPLKSVCIIKLNVSQKGTFSVIRSPSRAALWRAAGPGPGPRADEWPGLSDSTRNIRPADRRLAAPWQAMCSDTGSNSPPAGPDSPEAGPGTLLEPRRAAAAAAGPEGSGSPAGTPRSL